MHKAHGQTHHVCFIIMDASALAAAAGDLACRLATAAAAVLWLLAPADSCLPPAAADEAEWSWVPLACDESSCAPGAAAGARWCHASGRTCSATFIAALPSAPSAARLPPPSPSSSASSSSSSSPAAAPAAASMTTQPCGTATPSPPAAAEDATAAEPECSCSSALLVRRLLAPLALAWLPLTARPLCAVTMAALLAAPVLASASAGTIAFCGALMLLGCAAAASATDEASAGVVGGCSGDAGGSACGPEAALLLLLRGWPAPPAPGA